MARISLKQLHATTGEHVRAAAQSSTPIEVTDRGRPIAVLANPGLLKKRRRQRILLPEFEALMARPRENSVVDDLRAVRGER